MNAVAQGGFSSLQFMDAVRKRTHVVGACPELFPKGDQGFGVLHAVLLLQAQDQVQTLLQAYGLARVQGHGRSGPRGLGTNVLQFNGHAVQPTEQFVHGAVVAGGAGQLLADDRQGLKNALITGNAQVGGLQGLLDLARVLGALQFGLQPFLLALFQVGLVQFIPLEGDEIELCACPGLFVAQLAQLLGHGPPRLVVGTVGHHLLAVPHRMVHQSQLEAGVVQQQGVVLAVHVDQAFAQFAQLLQAHRGIVHEGPRAAAGVQLPADEQRHFVGHTGGLAPTVEAQVRRIHLQFNDAALVGVACKARVGPVAHGQPQRTDQDALAAACFTGNDGEPRGEVELQVVDKQVIGDRKPLEHDEKTGVPDGDKLVAGKRFARA